MNNKSKKGMLTQQANILSIKKNLSQKINKNAYKLSELGKGQMKIYQIF